MRVGQFWIGVVVLALVASGAAWAAESNIIRFAGASVNPTGELRVAEFDVIPLGDGTTLRVSEDILFDPDNAFGFCIDFEHRFSDRFGLGVTVMRSDHDLNARGSATATITDDATNTVLFSQTETISLTAGVDMTPVLVGANFHFGPNGKVDLYAGPFLGYVTFGDIVFENEREALKNEVAYGAVVGLDVPLGDRPAAFSVAARYMIASVEPDEPGVNQALDVDPWVLMFGVGYTF